MIISERKLTSHVSNTQAAKKQAARLALILTEYNCKPNKLSGVTVCYIDLK